MRKNLLHLVTGANTGTKNFELHVTSADPDYILSKIYKLHNNILQNIEAGYNEVLEPSDLINVLVEVSTDENSGNLDLKCYMAYPNFPVTIVPITPLKI